MAAAVSFRCAATSPQRGTRAGWRHWLPALDDAARRTGLPLHLVAMDTDADARFHQLGRSSPANRAHP